jgi:hypothetical protein
MEKLTRKQLAGLFEPQGGLQAIPTTYKGYRMRSRLEARWATFFDALGIRWEYEREGYNLGEGIFYLPDFWFTDYEMWAEVKPKEFTKEEREKCKRLVEQGKHECFLLDDLPDVRNYEFFIWGDESYKVKYWDFPLWQMADVFGQRAEPLKHTFQDYLHRVVELATRHISLENSGLLEKYQADQMALYKLAIVAARRARFE